MSMYTFSDLIHMYADSVIAGTSDTDLSKREAHVVGVLLHTAGNMYPSKVAYPPSDGNRDATMRAWSDALWDGNASALLEAAAPRLDIDKCRARAAQIVRNI